MARHKALGRAQPARDNITLWMALKRHTEAQGARGEVLRGRSARAVQPARMQSERSQFARVSLRLRGKL